MNESVSLVKKKQGKFSKKVKAVKEKIKQGSLIVKENVERRPKKPKQERGLVYIGHIPHGFYEPEMKQYFLQFGKVTNVRVCRSIRSGRSKGFGFVEFAEPEVAKVVANTMDNYLMFKRRLEAKYVPPEKQPKNLFKSRAWSETYTPYKNRIVNVTKLRNTNESDKVAVQRSKLAVKKINKTVKKLAEIGIQHKFQPINVQNPVEGTTPLVKKKSVEAKTLLGKKKAVEAKTPIVKKKAAETKTPLIKNKAVETKTPLVKKKPLKAKTKLVKKKAAKATTLLVKKKSAEGVTPLVKKKQVK